jgi:hypothetical protein
MVRDAFRVTDTAAAARMPRQPRRARSNAVTLITVDRRVWVTARELCEGDTRRIQILDAETVIVWNHPHH